MGLNLLCVLHVQVIANGLDKMPLDPLLTALIVPVITVIIALPITPNGLGMREYLFVQLLSAEPVVSIFHGPVEQLERCTSSLHRVP